MKLELANKDSCAFFRYAILTLSCQAGSMAKLVEAHIWFYSIWQQTLERISKTIFADSCSTKLYIFSENLQKNFCPFVFLNTVRKKLIKETLKFEDHFYWLLLENDPRNDLISVCILKINTSPLSFFDYLFSV